jgi:tRNA isopentenyl-2-thiomethyl-A-37 hydroxylase MiaE
VERLEQLAALEAKLLENLWPEPRFHS